MKKEDKRFIGIDIGTSSVCGVAYNFETKSADAVTRVNSSWIDSEKSWEMIQSPTETIAIVTGIIEEFLSKYPVIGGIGITGQMHGMLYVDENGNAVSPLYTWQDGRANQKSRNNQTYAEYLQEKTGYFLASGFGLVTHFYNQENGIIPPAAAKICTIMDYVVMKLTGGKIPVTDFSNGASLGFFNLQKLQFDKEALEAVGIDSSILPELKQSASLAGFYNENIPVYSAIGDNQASFLGSVKNAGEAIHITVGTSSQISIYSKNYIRVGKLDTRPFPGGGYILVGAPLCGGRSFAILKSFFESTLQFFTGDAAPKIDLYSKMVSLPDIRFQEEGLKVCTLFDGTRLEPTKRGSISNISTSNFTPEGMILGFVEGIVDELYQYYEAIPEEIKKDKKILVGSGNGIRRNPLLRAAFEQKFNLMLNVSDYEEEAALGASICAFTEGKINSDL